MTRPDSFDFQKIFLENTSLMDVRAPVEFQQGAFPSSQNIPLLDDEQRKIIGTHYKDQGQDAAIELGLELATPDIRLQRMAQWTQYIKEHPEGYLYCFRGGLRSRTTQAWLKEQGINYPLIKGGYKAMRSYLLEQLEVSAQRLPFFSLGGMTGSGKTRLLNKTPYKIDLEGLANHRGSAFGSSVDDFQPTQINWENQLSIACLQYRHAFPTAGLLLEDEGKRIGRSVVPLSFHDKMAQAPIIFLECSLEERIVIIREDYIEKNWPLYEQKYQVDAQEKFSGFVLGNLERIKKRLGGVRYKKVNTSFSLALEGFFSTGSSELFNEGIKQLLEEYYDPMYQYQLSQKQSKLLFKGSEHEVLAWVDEHLKKERA